jgi:hypothetical protein
MEGVVKELEFGAKARHLDFVFLVDFSDGFSDNSLNRSHRDARVARVAGMTRCS